MPFASPCLIHSWRLRLALEMQGEMANCYLLILEVSATNEAPRVTLTPLPRSPS